MPISNILRNDRLAVFGQSGGGKSALAHLLFRMVALPQTEEQERDDPQWRLIVDPTDSFVDPALTFFDPANIPWRKSYSLRFVPNPPTMLQQMDTLFAGIRAHGAVWILLDEVNSYSTSHSTPPNVLWGSLQGRKFGVGICTTTPRPRGINPAFFGNAQHLFSFLLTDPNDITAVAGSFGLTPSELRNLLYSLPDFAYLWYDVRRRTLFTMPPLRADLVYSLETIGESPDYE